MTWTTRFLVGATVAAAVAAQEAKFPLEAAQTVGSTAHQFRGMGDFDGDGDIDLQSYYNSTFVQLLNDGSGVFSPGMPLTLYTVGGILPIYPSPLATVALNNDGRMDFVAAFAQFVGGFLSNPSGAAPTPIWSIVETAAVNAMTLGDFNGDGTLDYALAVGAVLRLWLGNPFGNPTFGGAAPLPVYVNPATGNSALLRSVDVTGDGVPEILVNGSTYGFTPTTHLHFYSGATGSPSLVSSFTFSEPGPPMPTVGDVDGDLDVDLVLFYAPVGLTPAGYRVLRRTGAATLTAEPFIAGGPATDLADYDGDGDLDGICCGGGGTIPNQSVSKFEVSLNDGKGVFADAFTFDGRGSAGIVGAADLDGDGDRELVAGVSVFWNRGNAPVTGSPFAPLSDPFSAIRALRKFVDVDGDGDRDYFIGFGGGGWRRNDGSGTFVAGGLPDPAMAAGTVPVAGDPATIDFDGDGDEDALTETQLASNSAYVDVRRLKNMGGGVFVDDGPATGGVRMTSYTTPAATTITWSLGSTTTQVADFDGDGDDDLLTTSPYSTYFPSILTVTRTWLNDGTGFFTAGMTIPNLWRVVISDMDGDGLPELIGQWHPNGSAAGYVQAIWRNTGGTFAMPGAAETLPGAWTAASLSKLFVGDTDGDGDVDLVRGNGDILQNDGAGGLTLTQTIPVSYAVGALADFDGDGRAEILEGFGTFFTVFRRTTPTAPFAPDYELAAPYGALEAVVDLDGDGDLDLGGTTARRNTRFHAGGSGTYRQYGAGIAGLGGLTPGLGVDGALRVGESGVLRVAGGLGGAPAVLVIGATAIESPMLGGTLYVDPAFFLPLDLSGPAGVAGAGHGELPYFLTPGLEGLTIVLQAGVADPAAPSGFAASRALTLTTGT